MKILKFLNKYYWEIILILASFFMLIGARYATAALTRVNQNDNYITYSATAVSATTTNNISDTFPVATFTQGTFQIVWTGNTVGFPITFELQSSVAGGVRWDSISSSSVSSTGTTGSVSFDLSSLPGDKIRLRVTADGSSGSASDPSVLTPYFTGKKGK